jgi:hypothetical protein
LNSPFERQEAIENWMDHNEFDAREYNPIIKKKRPANDDLTMCTSQRRISSRATKGIPPIRFS